MRRFWRRGKLWSCIDRLRDGSPSLQFCSVEWPYRWAIFCDTLPKGNSMIFCEFTSKQDRAISLTSDECLGFLTISDDFLVLVLPLSTNNLSSKPPRCVSSPCPDCAYLQIPVAPSANGNQLHRCFLSPLNVFHIPSSCPTNSIPASLPPSFHCH
jgi:hypothetical protein